MLRIVVLNHSRPKNVGKLIDTFKKYFPMAIINNNPQEMFEYIGNGVDVINNEHNILIHTGYEDELSCMLSLFNRNFQYI